MLSDEAHELYEAPLALIRPDQVVAWRGFDDRDAQAVVAEGTGYLPSARPDSKPED